MPSSPLTARVVTIALRWCFFISVVFILLTYVPEFMPTLLFPGLVGGALMLVVMLVVVLVVLFGPPPGLSGSLNRIAYRPALIAGCVMVLVVMAALALDWAQDIRFVMPLGTRNVDAHTALTGVALKLLFHREEGLMLWKSEFASYQQSHVADLLRALMGAILALTPFPVAIAALRRDKTLVTSEEAPPVAPPLVWRQDRWSALVVLVTTVAAIAVWGGAKWAIASGMVPAFYDIDDVSLLPALAAIIITLGIVFLLEVFFLAADVSVDAEGMLHFRYALGKKTLPLAGVTAIRLHLLGLDTVVAGGKEHLVCFPECIRGFLAYIHAHYPSITLQGACVVGTDDACPAP